MSMNTGLNEPLRIALFTETFLPKVDGVVSILRLLLRRLEELGHHVLVVAPQGAPSSFAGAEVVSVRGPRLPFYPELRLNRPTREAWRRLAAFRPDIIHAVNPAFIGPVGLWWARRLGVPTLASFHTDIARYAAHYGYGFLSPAIWRYFRAIHNRAGVNVGPSTFVRDDLRRHGFRRVRWWKRGIDTDFFTPGPCDAAMRDRLTDGHPDDFVAVYIGRLASEKGLFVLRDAVFPQPGVRLALVGDGPATAELKAYFAGTPTTFPGYMQGDDLINAYRSADVFLFPSTTETFGLVALEAMACRLPVIAARAGGIVDSVIDGHNGFFYDPAQPQQIGTFIERLRAQPALREQLAANGLEHARNRAWRATMDQLVDYYRKAIRVYRLTH